MALTVTIDSVETADAAPTVAPHRISAQTGKSIATVKFTPSGGTGAIRAWRIMVGGTGRTTGRLAGERGMVCGIHYCGAPNSYSVSIPFSTQITEDVTFTEANDGGADGDRQVNVYAWDDVAAA